MTTIRNTPPATEMPVALDQSAPAGPATAKQKSDGPADSSVRGEPAGRHVAIGKGESAAAPSGGQRVVGGQLVPSSGVPPVPDRLFIGGQWLAPALGGALPVKNPATAEVIFNCPAATAEDMTKAVDAAREAFDSKIWSGLSGSERGKYLDAIAAKMLANQKTLAEIEVKNNGKPLGDAMLDVADAAACFSYYAEQARQLEQNPSTKIDLPDPNYRTKVVRQPIGVAAAVIPWNYPLLMAAWKVAPALAAGCTMVLKPSEVTPMSALKLGELVQEAGLPAGVLNIVPGTGAAAGAALTNNPKIDKLAFTGGTVTGSRIMQAAAANLKPVTLELGGKSAVLVFEDADVSRIVDWVLFGVFGNQGEVCSATSRLLVHEKIAPKFVGELISRAQELTVGDGMKDGVKFGPLVSEAHYKKVLEYVGIGVKEGATLATGGQRPKGVNKDGYFLEPTIFTNVREDMRIWNEEIFGPVLCVKTFKDEADAVRSANASEYGLGAAVMSKDPARCERVAAALDAGIVWINSSQPTFVQAPWGGFKKSGIGRELGPWGLNNYMQTKQITEYVGEQAFKW